MKYKHIRLYPSLFWVLKELELISYPSYQRWKALFRKMGGGEGKPTTTSRQRQTLWDSKGLK